MIFTSKFEILPEMFMRFAIIWDVADDPPGSICQMSQKKYIRQHLFEINENGLTNRT